MNIDLMLDMPSTHKAEMLKYQELYLTPNRTTSGSEPFKSSTSGIDYSSTSGGQEGVFQNIINELKTNKKCLIDANKLNEVIEEVNKKVILSKNQTILSANWTDDMATNSRWYYQVTDADVTVNTIVNVNIHIGDVTKITDMLPVTESFAGYYKLYASAQPSEDFVVDVVQQN